MKASIHCICLLLVVQLMACGSGSAERDKTAKPTRELSANGYITGVVKELQIHSYV